MSDFEIKGGKTMEKSYGFGGCVVSKNILEGKGILKWCVRDKPMHELDNGWRFFSDIDTDDYLADAGNMSVCDWGTIFEIEPAIMLLEPLPVGTELTFMTDHHHKRFVYTQTGKPLESTHQK